MDMTKNNMTPERIKEIMSIYGTNPNRWPAGERDAAQAWLVNNTHAYNDLDDARNAADTLDRALDIAAHPLTNTALLQARILKSAAQMPQDNNSHFTASKPANDSFGGHQPQVRFLHPNIKSIAATVLLAIGLGFGIGQMTPPTPSYSAAEEILAASLQNTYQESDYVFTPSTNPTQGDGS